MPTIFTMPSVRSVDARDGGGGARPVSIGNHRWEITKEQRQIYMDMFMQLGPINGKLFGNQARAFFMKSKLPGSILYYIWALCDVDNDGSLDANEFAIGMYLIQSKLKGINLPDSLPDNLKAMVSLDKTLGPIGLEDRLNYNAIFDQYDYTRQGFISGVQARQIFLKESGLPQLVLAEIWRLADTDSNGKLDREEFILANHLIAAAKRGIPMPSSLPIYLHTSHSQAPRLITSDQSDGSYFTPNHSHDELPTYKVRQTKEMDKIMLDRRKSSPVPLKLFTDVNRGERFGLPAKTSDDVQPLNHNDHLKGELIMNQSQTSRAGYSTIEADRLDQRISNKPTIFRRLKSKNDVVVNLNRQFKDKIDKQTVPDDELTNHSDVCGTGLYRRGSSQTTIQLRERKMSAANPLDMIQRSNHSTEKRINPASVTNTPSPLNSLDYEHVTTRVQQTNGVMGRNTPDSATSLLHIQSNHFFPTMDPKESTPIGHVTSAASLIRSDSGMDESESSDPDGSSFGSNYDSIGQLSSKRTSTTSTHTNEGARHTVLYAYQSNQPGDLSICVGDHILVTNKSPDGWWTGVKDDVTGLFPGSYVHPVPDMEQEEEFVGEHFLCTSYSAEDSTSNWVTAIYDYIGQQHDQLSFIKGDVFLLENSKEENGWLQGTHNGITGWFPSSYVVVNLSMASSSTNQSTNLNQPKRDVSTSSTPSGAIDLPIGSPPDMDTVIRIQNPKSYRVCRGYDAPQPPYLTLPANSFVTVTYMDPSGWWLGKRNAKQSVQKEGWFPSSHVKLMEKTNMRVVRPEPQLLNISDPNIEPCLANRVNMKNSSNNGIGWNSPLDNIIASKPDNLIEFGRGA